MIILGIDPGTATTGWGAIRKTINPNGDIRSNKIELLEYGCVKTSPDLKMPNRLLILRNEVAAIIKRHKPNNIVVERLFFNTNAKINIKIPNKKALTKGLVINTI